MLRGWAPAPLYLAFLLLGPGRDGDWGLSRSLDGHNALTWSAAALCMLLGEGLRLWGRRYIGRSSDTRKLKASSLVTGGPFARVRNPLYLGNLLVALALACASEVWFLPPLALLWLSLHYRIVIASEERLLHGLYGAEYDAYCRAVPRFLAVGRRLRSPDRSAASGNTADPKMTWREALWAERRQILGQALVLATMAARDCLDWSLVPPSW